MDATDRAKEILARLSSEQRSADRSEGKADSSGQEETASSETSISRVGSTVNLPVSDEQAVQGEPHDVRHVGRAQWVPVGREGDTAGVAQRMNPKYVQAQKEGKAPLEHLVYSVLEGDAAVHALGARKYGSRNWRIDPILASTYEGAILRHFKAWVEGEDIDPESGYSHLYHIRACCAIVLDSEKHGTLIDDRNRQESKKHEV